MANKPDDYFVKRGDGGWDVIREGDRRPTAHAETQEKAVACAKRLSRREGGDVLVLGRSGKIAREIKTTVPRARRRRRSS